MKRNLYAEVTARIVAELDRGAARGRPAISGGDVRRYQLSAIGVGADMMGYGIST
jgi:hypothetical protein